MDSTMSTISPVYVLSAGLEFFFALTSVILLIGCLFDHDRHRSANRLLIAILIVHALMNAIDACIWLWCDVPALLTLMKVLCFLSYALGHAIFVLFTLLLVSYLREFVRVPAWVNQAVLCLSGVAVVLWVLSMFNGMYYYWDEDGVCQIGDMFFVSQAFAVLFLSLSIGLVLFYRRRLPRRDCGILILYSAIPLIGCAFVPLWDVTPLYMASTISLLLYYTVLHVEHGQRVAKQQTRLTRQELELSDSRTAMMLSQIRPHFLYNTLTAIAQLCEKDPAKAKETTLNFAAYLRSNMNVLAQKVPVPFEREYAHVKAYLAIEQVRFAEALRIVFDIQATGFSIPALTLQPLAENAVKHGVGMKEEGGTVTIATRETPDCFLVTVTDDGVGFDPAQPKVDGRAHIGIANVRERLDKMMGAALTIDSVPGRGTTATIRIPKEEDDHDDLCRR